MRKVEFEDKDSWEKFRKGKITGTRLGDITSKTRGTGKKIGYYELIAERMGIYDTDENPMDRGLRLEPEAIAAFEKETGKKVEQSLCIWVSDFNENIAVSPDGTVVGEESAIEIKCLSSARYIEAVIEGTFPSEYELQVRQYFICNEKLQKIYFIMYDPRIAAKPLMIFEILRDEAKVQESLAHELQTLKEVDEWVAKLSGF